MCPLPFVGDPLCTRITRRRLHGRDSARGLFSCGMRGNADRNAAIVIGQRLITRHQEKPRTLPAQKAREDEKSSGEIICQDAKRDERPSISLTGRADHLGHGTAHERKTQDGSEFSPDSYPTTPIHRVASTRHILTMSDYGGVEEAAVPSGRAECHMW